MSWMNMLYQTYENNKQIAGRSDQTAILPMIAHMTIDSQLEITINADGDFISAAEVAKEDRKTQIPVTEASAARTNKTAPHALCDTLSYIAGDFSDFVLGENKGKAEEKYIAYIQNLSRWVTSEYSHPKAMAVYNYLHKKKTMKDLIDYGLVRRDESSGVLSNGKIGGQPYEKVMTRFIVLEGDAERIKECWRDISLMESYINYYLPIQDTKREICFVTGNYSALAQNHPYRIVPSSSKAKLISANDEHNFTYRGRFANAQEACTISYEVSQKAHNALRWLVEKQGVIVGTQDKRTYICWNPNGKKVPFVDRLISFDDEEDEEEETSYTEEIYRKKLFKAVQGYKNQLDDNDDIVIMGLDAATQGRLSVVCYNELKSSTFLEHLRYWNETCNWYFTRYSQDHKKYQEVYTPLAKQIVQLAYGTERETIQGENQRSVVEVNDKLFKEQVQRIYNCIINKMAIPKDLVRSIASKASNPLSYKNNNYEAVLSTACALIKKGKEGKVSMVLDDENTDRSYLFGRLLAVAEVAEAQALGENANRPTNATRLQSAFVNRPFSTWSNLRTALNPYLQRLSVASRKFYEDCIQNITCKFKETDLNIMDKSLDPEYLLGYYLQRKELNTKKNYNNNSVKDNDVKNGDTTDGGTSIETKNNDNSKVNREVQ